MKIDLDQIIWDGLMDQSIDSAYFQDGDDGKERFADFAENYVLCNAFGDGGVPANADLLLGGAKIPASRFGSRGEMAEAVAAMVRKMRPDAQIEVSFCRGAEAFVEAMLDREEQA